MAIRALAKVDFAWTQSLSMSFGDYYQIYVGADAAHIDYSDPLNPSPIEAWPGNEEGGDVFGDDVNGLGISGFGGIELSSLAYSIEMRDGSYAAAIVAYDQAGNATVPAPVTHDFVVAGTPRPPGAPLAQSYDKDTKTLVLTFSKSPDDGA